MTTLAMRRGAAAEDMAARFLADRGLDLLARNLRCKSGELDLVCLDRGTLVIVEVRRRSGRAFGGAAASVTGSKRRRLIRAAGYQCQRQPGWRARPVRFDVIAVDADAAGRPLITWIRDAFRAR